MVLPSINLAITFLIKHPQLARDPPPSDMAKNQIYANQSTLPLQIDTKLHQNLRRVLRKENLLVWGGRIVSLTRSLQQQTILRQGNTKCKTKNQTNINTPWELKRNSLNCLRTAYHLGQPNVAHTFMQIIRKRFITIVDFRSFRSIGLMFRIKFQKRMKNKIQERQRQGLDLEAIRHLSLQMENKS